MKDEADSKEECIDVRQDSNLDEMRTLGQREHPHLALKIRIQGTGENT